MFVRAFQGVIDTELGRHMQEKWYFRIIYPVMRVFIKTPLQGAQTQLYCCLEESIADHSGRYVQNDMACECDKYDFYTLY